MIRSLQNFAFIVFKRIEAIFNAIFGESLNPWYQLGSLSFYFMWILIVTGLYLYIFFDTSIVAAYESVEQLTKEQWYAGGVMRSMHRYASDAMVVTVSLHLLREFSLGRFRGVRWFSWCTGIPMLWLLFAAGIGGYLLVWDQLALYIAVVTSEWFDWFPLFSNPLARNFLSMETLTDRFFSLLIFLHIGIPLFLLVAMFIHIKRMHQARPNPPKAMMIGTVLAMIALSLIKPAVSMPAADLTQTVAVVKMDWIYLNLYPFLDIWGPGLVWTILLGGSLLLLALPWISPELKDERLPAKVDPENCISCGWCERDCPYEAISMVEHELKKGHKQAYVDPDLCTACGVCSGSCPTATPFRHVDSLVSGIEVPKFRVDRLRNELDEKIEGLQGEGRLVVFGCDHALDIERVESDNVAVLSVPCIGLLPPSFIDYVARSSEVDGVVVSGCCEEGCFYRKGSEWTRQRFFRQRWPHLRTKAAQHKYKLCPAGTDEINVLVSAIDSLQGELKQHRIENPEMSEKEGADND